MFFRLLASAFFLSAFAGAAEAQSVAARIRSENTIRCGGVPRTGLVGVAPDGRASGLYLDLCRAIGAALLGPDGRIEFHVYDSEKAFLTYAAIDDVSFLTASELLQEKLVAHRAPGPVVFFETTAVMVPDADRARNVADLAGRSICFSEGSSADRALQDWFADRKLDFIRMGYQEDAELHDAYNARHCDAQAGEAAALAALRLDPDGEALESRILEPALTTYAVLATTPIEDGRWAATVHWAIQTLLLASSGEQAALPIPGADLDLPADWAQRVAGAAGSYRDIFDRNLGAHSQLRLAPGPNADARAGGRLSQTLEE